MRIVVKYMAQLKQAAGVGGEAVEVEGPCDVAGLVRGLADGHGESFRRILLDAGGAVQPAILFFVGDEQVPSDSRRVFRDGDVLTILAPMAGG